MTNFIVLALLIVFSAFFSSTEIALTSLNRLRLDKLAEDGSRSARLTAKIEDRYGDALSTLLVGNNIVNTAASAISTVIALEVFGGDEALGGIVATAVITVVILIFGEILPKMVGKRIAIPLACACSYPLRVFMILFRPITIVVGGIVAFVSGLWRREGELPADAVTEEELSNIIETVEEEGVIDEDKGELLQSALDFSAVTAEEILTPRIDVLGLDLDDGKEEIFRTVVESNYSRFPVYHDSIDHISGVFYAAPFLKRVAEVGLNAVHIEDYVMETLYIHKTTKLPDALEKMREKKLHMVVVLDEYGGTLGIVTMEDLLEEIVGDIWDETDVIEEEVVRTGANTYEVLGTTNVEDFFDEIDFDARDFESEYTTVGGWAIEMLNEDIHVGDSFRYHNLYVEVTVIANNIVEKLTVLVGDEDDGEGEGRE